jgi:hypothetical protein
MIQSLESFIKGSFIEDDFLDELFNEDLLYDLLAEQYREDPCIKILTKSPELATVSRIAVHDYDNRTISVGGAQCEEPDYHIEPDYTPVEIMQGNYRKYQLGSLAPFEYVPVARPVIPSNKYYTADAEKYVEEAFIHMGAKILNATPGQMAKLEDRAEVLSYITPDMKGFHFDRYCMSMNDETVLKSKAIVVGLQLNPFHPASAAHIKRFQWDSEFSASGEWEYRNKFHLFSINLLDKRYRLHSDQWLRAVSRITADSRNYFECFDMVSNVDFVDSLTFLTTRSVVEPVVVEPIFTDRVPERGYSVIGPWEGQIHKGQSDTFYAPYLTPSFSTVRAMNRYRLCPNVADVDSVTVNPKSKEDMVVLQRSRNSIHSDRYFMKANSVSVEVYERHEAGTFMFEETEMKIMNFPSNFVYDPGTGSRKFKTLVYGFRCTDIFTSIIERRSTVMDRVMASHVWGQPVWDLDLMLTAFGDEADIPDSYVTGSIGSFTREGTCDRNVVTIKPKPKPFKDKSQLEKLAAASHNNHLGRGIKKPKFVPPRAEVIPIVKQSMTMKSKANTKKKK